jgi:hypothetical protein
MDTTAIILGIISFLGTVIGTFAGIITSAKLTNYRLEQLEKKVDKHNSLVERMYKIEERVSIVEKGGK